MMMDLMVDHATIPIVESAMYDSGVRARVRLALDSNEDSEEEQRGERELRTSETVLGRGRRAGHLPRFHRAVLARRDADGVSNPQHIKRRAIAIVSKPDTAP